MGEVLPQKRSPDKTLGFLHSVDKPSAPENLSVSEMTENTVKLRWAEPSDNGGCIIKQYVIEKREASKRAWQREGVATDTEYQVIALNTSTARTTAGRGFDRTVQGSLAKKLRNYSCETILYHLIQLLNGVLCKIIYL